MFTVARFCLTQSRRRRRHRHRRRRRRRRRRRHRTQTQTVAVVVWLAGGLLEGSLTDCWLVARSLVGARWLELIRCSNSVVFASFVCLLACFVGGELSRAEPSRAEPQHQHQHQPNPTNVTEYRTTREHCRGTTRAGGQTLPLLTHWRCLPACRTGMCAAGHA